MHILTNGLLMKLMLLHESLDISEDKHTEWQVLEGLGAVCYAQGDFENAVTHFRDALEIVGETESNLQYRNRINEKLKHAEKGCHKQKQVIRCLNHNISTLFHVLVQKKIINKKNMKQKSLQRQPNIFYAIKGDRNEQHSDSKNK